MYNRNVAVNKDFPSNFYIVVLSTTPYSNII